MTDQFVTSSLDDVVFPPYSESSTSSICSPSPPAEDMTSGGHHPARIGETLKGGRYRILARLGSGHFSTVWLCLDSARISLNGRDGGGQGFEGSAVAVKIQKSANRYSDAARDEIRLLRAVHERDPDGTAPIVSLLDSFLHSGPNGRHVCLVFNVMGRSLLSLIKRFRYRGVPMPIVREIARNLLKGLHFLHGSAQIIHTDLKPENVLFVPSSEQCAALNWEATRFAADLTSRKSKKRVSSRGGKHTSFGMVSPHLYADDRGRGVAVDHVKSSDNGLTKNQRKRLKAKERKAKARSKLDEEGVANLSMTMEAERSVDDWDSQAPPAESAASCSPRTCCADDDCSRSPKNDSLVGKGTIHVHQDEQSSHRIENGEISSPVTLSRLAGSVGACSSTRDCEPIEDHALLQNSKSSDHCVSPCNSAVGARCTAEEQSNAKAVNVSGLITNRNLDISEPELELEKCKEKIRTDGRFKVYDFIDHDELYRHAKISIIDLGNACWTDSHSGGVIQTRQYRSPEVIMGSRFAESADMWSLACIIFELATGEFLFDPHSGRDYDRDEDHLGQMMELLGPIPRTMLSRGVYAQELFNRRGELRHIRDLKFWPLHEVLTQKYEMDTDLANTFSDFLLQMLRFEPSRRATAAECLRHCFVHDPDSPD